MIYYLSGQNEDHIRAVLIELYEATIGKELLTDPETARKNVPQNDGRIQFHHLFEDWVTKPGVPDPQRPGQYQTPPEFKAGFHCAIGIIPSKDNPQGLIGPNDTVMIEGAGIEVLREDEIAPDQLALLPKFQ